MTRTILALVAAVTMLSARGPASAAPDPIKIGVDMELSGPASGWGTPQLNSIQLYVDEANAKGGINGRPLQLEVLDNKSDPSQSKLNATKLIDDGVVAILGAGNTPDTMPMVPLVNAAKVPTIANAAAGAVTSPIADRPYVFKTAPEDPQNSEKMAQFLIAHKWTTIAFLSVNTGYGDSGHASFPPVAAEHGLRIIDDARFAPGDTDMTPQLSKIRDEKADAVVIWGNPPATTIIAKNATQLGLKAKLLYSGGAGGAEFLAAGNDIKGVYICETKLPVWQLLPASDKQRAILDTYIREYKAKFHTDPDAISSFAADGIQLLIAAMRKGGPTRAGITAALNKMTHFPSTSGFYTFSASEHAGLQTSDLVIAQATGSGWSIAMP
jgi:branched-chain amino acid transport system substrate-binding protein